MPCDLCGEYYFNEETDGHRSKELDIIICDDCQKKVEEHHKVDGKFVVIKCSECHKVKEVKWMKYKKRGRMLGSKNKPKPGEPQQTVLGIQRQTAIT